MINYKSDFDFTIRLGDSFPAYDFRGVVTSGASAVRSVEFSKRGEELVNCFDDGGAIHVVCNDHQLPPGRVMVELFAKLPDSIFPDGERKVVEKFDTGIELSRLGDDWNGTPISIDLCLPYALVTAYDLAVAAGYIGTPEEFNRALVDAPMCVSTLTNINALTSDWMQGKAAIAKALTAQGTPSTPDETFADLARKVAEIPKRVDGEDGLVNAATFGLPSSDMINVLHNHQRADYPYCCGVSMSGISYTLAGADAYLCSDGYFTTEGGVHEWEDFSTVNWIIYYFRDANYVPPIPPESGGYLEYVVYSGAPVMRPFVSKSISRLIILPAESSFGSGLIDNDSYIQEIYANCSNTPTGWVARTCSGLRVLNFPNLREIKSTILPLTLTVKFSCLIFPALESTDVTSGGSTHLVSDKLYCPILKRVSGFGNHWQANKVYFPELIACEGFGYYTFKEIYLGHQESTETLKFSGAGSYAQQTTLISVEPGFRCPMDISKCTSLSAECLSNIINNLGNNNGNATLTINMGATNLAKLTPETIALANSKNYTLL